METFFLQTTPLGGGGHATPKHTAEPRDHIGETKNGAGERESGKVGPHPGDARKASSRITALYCTGRRRPPLWHVIVGVSTDNGGVGAPSRNGTDVFRAFGVKASERRERKKRGKKEDVAFENVAHSSAAVLDLFEVVIVHRGVRQQAVELLVRDAAHPRRERFAAERGQLLLRDGQP